jgi:hypothetical protein
MAQMLEDLERAGVLAPLPESSQAEPPGPSTADRAQTLEDISRVEAESRPSAPLVVARTPTGSAVLGDGQASPTVLVEMGEPLPTDHHDAEEKKGQGYMAAHLGLEGAEKAAHALAHGAGHAKAQAAAEAASAKGQAVAEAASAKGQALAEAATASAELGTVAAGLMIGGAIGSAVVGVGVGALGIHQLTRGIQQKDSEKILEGTSATILGSRSVLAATTMAGQVAGEGALATLGQAAHAVLAPLGVAHGALDVALGTKYIVDGVRQGDRSKVIKGGLTVGLGTSLALAAVGGGVPALVAAGVFLGAKVVHGVRARKGAAPGEHTPA